MLNRTIVQASPWRSHTICLFCAARGQTQQPQPRSFNTSTSLLKRERQKRIRKASGQTRAEDGHNEGLITKFFSGPFEPTEKPRTEHTKKSKAEYTEKTKSKGRSEKGKPEKERHNEAPMSLKEALLGQRGPGNPSPKQRRTRAEQLHIQKLYPDDLKFEAVQVDVPPVPMLSYGLDRVLFNPGVYLLQDPRSRVYNFDPYLEKVMPVNEFNFEALSEYKTSSKDQDLLDLTKKLGTKFTGSTSSMSGVLQHFHYLLSNFRDLNHSMLSRGFPEPSKRFSKITTGPSAVFLRYKDGIYAIDADKTYDRPNIMSWLGHSLEKLLTTSRDEFELFRRSSLDKAPPEDSSSRCYHYSTQGNILMRSQLDAHDPRLPGTGVFDLKTRAVVSIRMNHKEYEAGSGYQLRFAQGEWESFEREFYDMTRATMLKYSLQVRMGRMDGIFVAFHNIERIFGFQYLSLGDMDQVLHGQSNTALGDREFKLSVGLLDELLSKATAQFPETSLRLHVETRDAKTPFMYVFAEPVTEQEADEIQSAGDAAQKEFAQTVVGLEKDDPEVQQAWQSIQEKVDEQVDEDTDGKLNPEPQEEGNPAEETSTSEAAEVAIEANSNLEASADSKEEPESTSGGPLIGWTLTVRSKVNGNYVERPVQFEETDEWSIEYHVQEIPEQSRWRLYNAVKERRRGLIGMEDKEVDKGLQSYRDLIQRFSNRGREWRKEQDQINEELGVQLYKPLGPGSDEAVADAATTSSEGS